MEFYSDDATYYAGHTVLANNSMYVCLSLGALVGHAPGESSPFWAQAVIGPALQSRLDDAAKAAV
jgi:hypothetical protein